MCSFITLIVTSWDIRSESADRCAKNLQKISEFIKARSPLVHATFKFPRYAFSSFSSFPDSLSHTMNSVGQLAMVVWCNVLSMVRTYIISTICVFRCASFSYLWGSRFSNCQVFELCSLLCQAFISQYCRSDYRSTKMPGVSRLRHVYRSHPIQDVPRA